MDIKNKLKDVNIFFFLKVGIGSAIAILIADRLGLAYSASAGIITLLTIQNTNKETILISVAKVIKSVYTVYVVHRKEISSGYFRN